MLGTPELVLVVVIILLIFGVGKLPEVFRSLGQGVREFRDAASNSDEEKKEDDAPDVAKIVK